jgi:hypothetical protein
MKLVYSHPNFAQVGAIRSLLEQARIPCVTRNEHLSSLAGGLPALDVWPQLWVADEDVLLARSVLSEFDQAPEIQSEDWVCPRCGASNEGNMGACWNCDWEIDGPENQ